MKKVLLFFLVFVFIFCGKVLAANYPDYTGYVNDFSHVLSTSFVTNLNARLSDFDKKTTDQIAVVTVDSTQPETIEEYSIHLADKWKVGQKGKDNGVIMLFAMKDHMMRIEVGRGLEGDLTDIQAKHIETNIITPQFKNNQYETGINNGVTAVIAAITHDASAASALQATAPSSTTSSGVVIFIIVVFFLILFFAIAFSPYTRLGGRGRWGMTTVWGDHDSGSGSDSGGFGGFGGGGFSGGGASSSW